MQNEGCRLFSDPLMLNRVQKGDPKIKILKPKGARKRPKHWKGNPGISQGSTERLSRRETGIFIQRQLIGD